MVLPAGTAMDVDLGRDRRGVAGRPGDDPARRAAARGPRRPARRAAAVARRRGRQLPRRLRRGRCRASGGAAGRGSRRPRSGSACELQAPPGRIPPALVGTARALPRRVLSRPPARRLPRRPATPPRSCAGSWPLRAGVRRPRRCVVGPLGRPRPGYRGRRPHRLPAELAGLPAAGRSPPPSDPEGPAGPGRGPAPPARHTSGPATAARPGDRRAGHRERQRRRARRVVPRPRRRSVGRSGPGSAGRRHGQPGAAARARPGGSMVARPDAAGAGMSGSGARCWPSGPPPSRSLSSSTRRGGRSCSRSSNGWCPRSSPPTADCRFATPPPTRADRSRRLDVDFRLGPDTPDVGCCTAPCTGASAPRPGPAHGPCPRRRAAPSSSTTAPPSAAPSDCTSDEGAIDADEEPGASAARGRRGPASGPARC